MTRGPGPRRRATGPPGSVPPDPPGGLERELAEQVAEIREDPDERLRREVPPHHGS